MKEKWGLWLLTAFASFAGIVHFQWGGEATGFMAYVLGGWAAYEWMVYGLAIRGVSVKRKWSHQRVVAGDSIKVELTVRRKLPLPFSWLLIRERMDWTLNVSTGSAEFFLPHQKEYKIEYQIHHLRRGRYRFEGVELFGGDWFGLVTRTRMVKAHWTLWVYPRIKPITLDGQPARWGTETGLFRRLRDGQVVTGVRPYRLGDRLHQIHWKRSARGQGLVTKERDQEMDEKVQLVLDQRNRAYRGKEEAFERAVTLTASLAHMMHQQKQPLHVSLTGKKPFQLTVAPTEESYITMLETLAMVKPDGNHSLKALFERTWFTSSQWILVTPLLDEDALLFATEAAKKGMAFACFLVADRLPEEWAAYEGLFPIWLVASEHFDLSAPHQRRNWNE